MYIPFSLDCALHIYSLSLFVFLDSHIKTPNHQTPPRHRTHIHTRTTRDKYVRDDHAIHANKDNDNVAFVYLSIYYILTHVARMCHSFLMELSTRTQQLLECATMPSADAHTLVFKAIYIFSFHIPPHTHTHYTHTPHILFVSERNTQHFIFACNLWQMKSMGGRDGDGAMLEHISRT